MAHYLVQGSYTPAAIKAMVGSPQDRSAAARALIESAGGRLHHFLFSFGDNDYVILCELPDPETAAAVAMVVRGTGSMSSYRTTPLLTPAEAMQAMNRAKSINYTPPAS